MLDVPAHVRGIADDDAPRARALRAQIAVLEHRLSGAVVDSMPDGGVDTRGPARRGPRVLTLGELERLRDALADRVAQARALLEERERSAQEAAACCSSGCCSSPAATATCASPAASSARAAAASGTCARASGSSAC